MFSYKFGVDKLEVKNEFQYEAKRPRSCGGSSGEELIAFIMVLRTCRRALESLRPCGLAACCPWLLALRLRFALATALVLALALALAPPESSARSAGSFENGAPEGPKATPEGPKCLPGGLRGPLGRQVGPRWPPRPF